MLVVLGLFVGSFLFLFLLSTFVWLSRRKVELKGIPKRSVLVTGCDTGFGHLLSLSLDARGVRVFSGCLTENGANSLKDKTSSRVTSFTLDITNRESVAKGLELVKTSLNGEGLWGLVNNAGVMPTFAPIEWTSMDEFEFTCNVNLFGTISVTKAFLPLVRRCQGRIVNVCSVTSNCGYPGISTYVISKAAVKQFSVCLRRELLNTGVSVHTIEPGGFQTNITSKDRLRKVFRESMNRADPETREFYGGNIATLVYNGFSLVKKYVSTEPQLVPDNMMHALFAKYPKQTYLVGWDALLFFRFIGFLPAWAVDYILGWPRPYGPRLSELKEKVST